MELLLIFDVLLVLFSVYFGINAVFMFKETNIGKIVDELNVKKHHKIRLLYSTIFLGATLVLMSILQLVDLTLTPILFLDWAMTAVYLAFLSSTYAWYGFLKEASNRRALQDKDFTQKSTG